MAQQKQSKTIIDPRIKVEVKRTEKHPGYKESKVGYVPEHMIPHLVKRGMIEKPGKV